MAAAQGPLATSNLALRPTGRLRGLQEEEMRNLRRAARDDLPIDELCALWVDRIADEIGIRAELGDPPLWHVVWVEPGGHVDMLCTRSADLAAAQADAVRADPRLTLDRHVALPGR